jgi:hypothetical protein
MSKIDIQVSQDRMCATRALKNARHIRAVAPQVFPAVEPLDGFASVLPFDVLNRFHRMTDDELSRHPHLLEAARKLRQGSPSGSAVPAPSLLPILFPLFKGTVHLAKITFNNDGAIRTFSDTDMAMVLQYLKVAAPAIIEYTSQYGECRLDVAPNILELKVDIHLGKYNDDMLQGWIKTLLTKNNLPHDSSCIVVFNPDGIVNTDGDGSKGIGGYHDAVEGSPYCFCNVGGSNFTVQDRQNHYAETLSHEVAEMVVDPLISFLSPEVCDGCAGNCSNRWLAFFASDSSGNPHYLTSARKVPPLPFNHDFFLAAVARPKNANDCPPPESGCNYAPPGDKQSPEQIRTASGKLAFLRVHRLGSGFGPPSDFLDVEVVIGIKGAQGGFGVTLRNDNNRFAHGGMLDLLRDVFNSDTAVEVEYTVDPGEFGKINGTILRVTRRK